MNAPASNLYSRDILRLAMALPHEDRLIAPDGSATCRAPLCGSEMTAEVALGINGTIAALAIRAHACALGQASAAMVRERATGLDRGSLIEVRDALQSLLTGDEPRALPWDELRHFSAARDHKARHGAILLPYEALLKALDDAL
jgi:NifU-like protein involved in Fe-S cluster formation